MATNVTNGNSDGGTRPCAVSAGQDPLVGSGPSLQTLHRPPSRHEPLFAVPVLATSCLAIALALAGAMPFTAVAAQRVDVAGRYTGKITNGGGTLTFTVDRGGRVIRHLATTIPAFCVGATLGGNHEEILRALVPSARLSRSHRFAGTYTTGGTKITYTGALSGGRATGKLAISVAGCDGNSPFTARRTH